MTQLKSELTVVKILKSLRDLNFPPLNCYLKATNVLEAQNSKGTTAAKDAKGGPGGVECVTCLTAGSSLELQDKP